SGRDTLQFAVLMAGAQTPTSNTRNSTFNGLPNASLNISIDGINNNSQRFKTGGTSFFAFAPLRLDAIEEVSVASAGLGADAASGGAMTMRFVTRRGTNQLRGRLFHQFENDALNANAFFNNAREQARPKVRRNDFGGNLGGPIPLPFTQKKLYFFVNFEAAPRPATNVRSVAIFTQEAQSGIFKYNATDGSVRSVNLLQLAGAGGFSTTADPTVRGIFNVINGTVSKGTGTIPDASDPNRFTLQWRQPANSKTVFPTARLDYQISSKLAWHGTWNLRWNKNDGVPQYPELPQLGNSYKITTYVASNALDWTITPTLLNTFNFGVQSNGEYFYAETNIFQWAEYGHRRIAIPNTTPTIPNQTPFIRNNPVYNLYDNLNWVRGKHTFTIGGALLRTSFWETTWNNAGVLNYNLGAATGDPITSTLSAASFPGIRTQDLPNAWALYAGLTGRLSSITGSRNVDEITHQFNDFSPVTWRQAFATGGLYFQDSFRVTPRLTLNYGFRWEISGAQHNTNGIYTSPTLEHLLGPSRQLFRPGVIDGVTDPQILLRPYPYEADKFNPAPNFGFAWRPSKDSGAIGKLFGDKTVIRASYGITYYDEGLNTIQNRAGNNPGLTQTITLNPGMPGFALGGLSLGSSIPPAQVSPATLAFPLAQSLFTFTNSAISTTSPKLHTPYVQNWTLGIQRELARNTVLELRYVGNKSTHAWHSYQVSETNIFENGFLPEFRNAQRNLEISLANGNVSNFANRNLPGQVPLPIFEAAFGARGSQPALAATSGFTSGTFINNLQLGNAGTLANTLGTNNLYFCRLAGNTFGPCSRLGFNAPGSYPINMFRGNPYYSTGNLLDDNSYSTYNGLQVELRKAYSNGLDVRANYTWSKSLSDLFNLTDQTGADNYITLRNRDLDKGPAAFDLRHAFTAYWSYDFPFGKGRKWVNHGGLLNRVIGGWQISGIHRFNSGQVYRLTSGRNTFNNLADSGVILNGITLSELQDRMRTFGPGPTRNAISDATLVGRDGRAHPQVLSVPATPGELGQQLFLYGTPLAINDMALLKVVPIKERLRFSFQVEALNVFNHPVLGVGTANIDSSTFGQTTTTIVGARNLQIRLRLDW
ncbi:MAG: hypothetical protein ACRD8O_19190, partial [Bryobacteraceae bacterium]